MPRKHLIIPMEIWNIDSLNVTERLVGAVIYGYTANGKPCFMTNTGLSKLLRVSKRTASAAVSKLVDGGFVEASGGGSKRHLTWKLASMGVEAIAPQHSSQLLPVIYKSNKEYKNTLMEMDGVRDIQRPSDWRAVRDYFRFLDDQDASAYRGNLEPWARDFVAYYEARGWKNKHGEIKEWRPVALAWYKRSAERAPRRAIQRRDEETIRADIRWHERRYEGYKDSKPHLAAGELAAIQQLKKQLP